MAVWLRLRLAVSILVFTLVALSRNRLVICIKNVLAFGNAANIVSNLRRYLAFCRVQQQLTNKNIKFTRQIQWA